MWQHSVRRNWKNWRATGMKNWNIFRYIHQAGNLIPWSIPGTHTTVLWHSSGHVRRRFSTVVCETVTDTAIPCRIFRVWFILHRRWHSKRSGLCFRHRWITEEDFRLSNLHTMPDMRIRRMMLPMYRKPGIRHIVRMMLCGCFQRYINILRSPEIWHLSMKWFRLPIKMKPLYTSTWREHLRFLWIIWDRTDFRQDFMRTGMTVCVWAKMESPRLLHCSFIMQWRF